MALMNLVIYSLLTKVAHMSIYSWQFFFRNARYPMERVYKNYQICFTLSIDDLQAQTKKKV